MRSLRFRSRHLAAAFLATLVVGLAAPAIAADAATPVAPRARVTEVYRPVGHPSYQGCPDRYSCYPLYGAYGPYGGVGFWGAYTGWYR
jgi:opacity protein-like surface antigen